MILRDYSSASGPPRTDVHALPASHVSFSDSNEIFKYATETANPTASISRVVTTYDGTPSVAKFSSRGSNPFAEVMKPDIIAPGDVVFAAYPPNAPNHVQGSLYELLRGTSMAAPHVAGALALLKSLAFSFSSFFFRSCAFAKWRSLRFRKWAYKTKFCRKSGSCVQYRNIWICSLSMSIL